MRAIEVLTGLLPPPSLPVCLVHCVCIVVVVVVAAAVAVLCSALCTQETAERCKRTSAPNQFSICCLASASAASAVAIANAATRCCRSRLKEKDCVSERARVGSEGEGQILH